MENKKSNALAVCSLIFSLLFALVGLILGIVGVNSYEEGSSGKTMSTLAIVISCINMVLGILIMVG